MKFDSYEREPCGCPECYQAGMSERPQVRDGRSGEWLHGYPLKRWYEAKERFWAEFKSKFASRGMR